MLATLIIVIVTFIILTSCILFLPSVTIRKCKVGTYWMVALVGAVVLLASRLVPIGEVWRGLTADSGINPIKILVLFFSMTFLSVVLDELGFFRYLADRAVKAAGKSQLTFFILFYFLTAILTVFTSNDVVVLTLTPFICFFCKNADVDPIPYLVAEFAAANTWSMMLVIGNPTNIYLASFAGIDFISYLGTMVLPTLVAGAVEFGIIFLIFRNKLKTEISSEDNERVLPDKPSLIVGLAHLGVCLICLIISGYIRVEMWLVSAVCAGSLFICMLVMRLVSKRKTTYLTSSLKRLPWQLIPFVLSMFVIVICLEYQEISARIAAFLGEKACVWTYGFSSYIAANLINNIPMSILFGSFPVALSETARLQAVYASVIGSNIGAFLTPIGALAGIMFTELTSRYDVKFGFGEFVRYGTVVSLPTIAAALAVLFLVL